MYGLLALIREDYVVGLRCNSRNAERARACGFYKPIEADDSMSDDAWDLIVVTPPIAKHISCTIGFQNPPEGQNGA